MPIVMCYVGIKILNPVHFWLTNIWKDFLFFLYNNISDLWPRKHGYDYGHKHDTMTQWHEQF